MIVVRFFSSSEETVVRMVAVLVSCVSFRESSLRSVSRCVWKVVFWVVDWRSLIWGF